MATPTTTTSRNGRVGKPTSLPASKASPWEAWLMAGGVHIPNPVDRPALLFFTYPASFYRQPMEIERPPEAVLAALSVLLNTERRHIAAAVAALIDHLDALDGDADLELQSEDEGAQCDDEGCYRDEAFPGDFAYEIAGVCGVAP